MAAITGFSFYSLELFYVGRPNVTTTLFNVAIVGEYATLQCDGDAFPPPKMFVSRDVNGLEPITNSTKYQVQMFTVGDKVSGTSVISYLSIFCYKWIYLTNSGPKIGKRITLTSQKVQNIINYYWRDKFVCVKLPWITYYTGNTK